MQKIYIGGMATHDWNCIIKSNTPSDPEHTGTEFLMEFLLFRYHKIRKEILIFLTFPISNVFSRVILSCVCVSWGVFCAIKRNCIVLYTAYTPRRRTSCGVQPADGVSILTPVS